MSIEKSLEEVLTNRGAEYGGFEDMAGLAQALKKLTESDLMLDFERESMDMICSKISRIVCGNPHNADSWRDIAGYAELVVKILSN